MRKKAIHVNWVRGFFPFGFSCTDTLWYFSTAHSDSSVLAAPLACHPSHVDAVSCIVRTVRNDKVAKWTHHKTKETKVKGSRKTTMTMSPQVMAIVMSAFLRPLSSLPTLNWRDVVVYLWVRVAGQAALNQLYVAAPKGLTDMMSSQLRTVWLRHIELNQWKIWWRFEIWMTYFIKKLKKIKNRKKYNPITLFHFQIYTYPYRGAPTWRCRRSGPWRRCGRSFASCRAR